MNQHFAGAIVGQHFYIVGIGQIDFAEILRVARATGIQLAD